MDLETLIKEVIREEVRAWILNYGNKGKEKESQKMIPVKAFDNVSNEYSIHHIDATIDRAIKAGNFKTKTEMLSHVFNGSVHSTFMLISNLKKGKRQDRLEPLMNALLDFIKEKELKNGFIEH